MLQSKSKFNSFKSLFTSSSLADVIKSAIRVSPLSFIRLACGFIRSKVAAIIIGVAGVGILGQANQFLLLITTVGSLGMVNSLMQQISHYRENGDNNKLGLVKGTVLTSQFLFFIFSIVIVLFWFKPITFFFFNSTSSEFAFLILLICIASPLNILASNYLEGFFTAYHRFDLYVKSSSIVTLLNLLLFIPAVYLWKIEGGLISILCGEILLFILFLYYVLKLEKFKNIFLFRFDKEIFKLTITDGMVNLTCAFLATGSGLLLRQLVIKQTGEFTTGIYQFCLSITAYYTPFLTNLLWSKYFPLISAKKIIPETKALIYNTLIFVVITGAILTSGIMIFSNPIIRILATKDFLPAEQYLPIQFIGDFWYFIFYLYSIFLLAMRMVKRYLIIWVVFLSVQYMVSLILVTPFGLNGVMIGYSIGCMIAGGISLLSFVKLINSKVIQLYSKILMIFGFVLLESALSIFEVHLVIKLILFIAWLIWYAKPLILKKLDTTSFNIE